LDKIFKYPVVLLYKLSLQAIALPSIMLEDEI